MNILSGAPPKRQQVRNTQFLKNVESDFNVISLNYQAVIILSKTSDGRL